MLQFKFSMSHWKKWESMQNWQMLTTGNPIGDRWAVKRIKIVISYNLILITYIIIKIFNIYIIIICHLFAFSSALTSWWLWFIYFCSICIRFPISFWWLFRWRAGSLPLFWSWFIIIRICTVFRLFRIVIILCNVLVPCLISNIIRYVIQCFI